MDELDGNVSGNMGMGTGPDKYAGLGNPAEANDTDPMVRYREEAQRLLVMSREQAGVDHGDNALPDAAGLALAAQIDKGGSLPISDRRKIEMLAARLAELAERNQRERHEN